MVDVCGDFEAVGQPNASDLPQGGVGLLGGHGSDLHTYAPSLRGAFAPDYLVFQGIMDPMHSRRLGLLTGLFTALSYKLIYGRHRYTSLSNGTVWDFTTI